MSKANNPTQPESSVPAAKKSRKPAAFDVWLKKSLHEIFDEVASEPIPEDLLRLIEEDRKR